VLEQLFVAIGVPSAGNSHDDASQLAESIEFVPNVDPVVLTSRYTPPVIVIPLRIASEFMAAKRPPEI
jgi:hypothetical protein